MNFKKGNTMQEILLVVAILMVILFITLPAFRSSRDQQVLKSTTLEVYSSINKARSQALASLDSSEYGVHFQSDQVVIFKGTSYSSNDPDNEIINVSSPASISNINLSGGGSALYFSRLYGEPNKTGTITILVGSTSKNITISATGIVSVD